MLWVENKILILHCRTAASACEELRKAASDRSLHVMDSTPLPCDVHAHLMLKWPIHGTIVFQSCQGKVQNGAHFLLHGVITMPQFTARPSTLPEHKCPTACCFYSNISSLIHLVQCTCIKNMDALYLLLNVLQTAFH